jgi:hypothetical protein
MPPMSEIARSIKARDNPNDIFITPIDLCKQQIDMIDYLSNEVWFDPFKNSGNYYNHFPNENKTWTEILENKDFFDFNEPVDIICSNPPYSILDKVLKKTIELKPRVFSYLIGMNSLTTKRLEEINNAGYALTKLRLLKVYTWFGMSIIAQFEKDKQNILSYDRKIYGNTRKKK